MLERGKMDAEADVLRRLFGAYCNPDGTFLFNEVTPEIPVTMGFFEMPLFKLPSCFVLLPSTKNSFG